MKTVGITFEAPLVLAGVMDGLTGSFLIYLCTTLSSTTGKIVVTEYQRIRRSIYRGEVEWGGGEVSRVWGIAVWYAMARERRVRVVCEVGSRLRVVWKEAVGALGWGVGRRLGKEEEERVVGGLVGGGSGSLELGRR